MQLTVHPYRTLQGVWAFDHDHPTPTGQETKGELLLNGTELVIDAYFHQLTGREPKQGDRITFVLDTEPLADATTVITHTGGDEHGSTYVDQQTGMPLWLCPWLQGFFGHVPPAIYIRPSVFAG